jgi:putative tryptophan/tyrosine transport system substrate-binding protein
VFNSTGDPVKLGLVASYNRPGGNVTGVTSLLQELGAKRLGFLHELLPGAARFAVLVQESNPFKVHERVISDLRSAASTLGLQIEILSAVSNRDIDTAFATFRQKRAATRPGTCTAR